MRRSARDWVVDSVLFLLAVLFGLFTSWMRLESTMPSPEWLFEVDQAVGMLGCIALWWRRRFPVHVAVALVVASTLSEMISGAMVIGLFSVAVHRPPRTSLAIFGLGLLSALGYSLLRPDPGVPMTVMFGFGLTLQGGAVGWGLMVHNRRKLVDSLRERALRAENEAKLRAEQAQHLAREEIAREIHDVLGHRLSLLSLHAGALSYRPDAPPAEVANAAEVIRDSAHLALQDLREVVGVLRAPVGELPQPTFADLPRLAAESERAATPVTLHLDVDGEPHGTPGRTAYRVVQEGLTNAHKHAPGAAVTITVTGRPGDALAVEIVNELPPRTGPGPEAGQGLLGLAERVELAGGEIEHGPGPAGWRLAARIPWPA